MKKNYLLIAVFVLALSGTGCSKNEEISEGSNVTETPVVVTPEASSEGELTNDNSSAANQESNYLMSFLSGTYNIVDGYANTTGETLTLNEDGTYVESFSDDTLTWTAKNQSYDSYVNFYLEFYGENNVQKGFAIVSYINPNTLMYSDSYNEAEGYTFLAMNYPYAEYENVVAIGPEKEFDASKM